VFAALAASSLVDDRTGWSIRKIVRTAAGTAPSRSAPEPPQASPKASPRDLHDALTKIHTIGGLH
jgi:hypothetical protein